MIALAHKRMRRSSASKMTSPAFVSWVNLQGTSLTLTLISPESVPLRIAELENALCNQDKLLCKVFRENKRLNLELGSAFSKIASLRSVHDDMSAKSCDNCKMIMVNYADMWIVHSQVARLLDGARFEIRELKTRYLLLGAYTSCTLLRSDLEAYAVEIKDLKFWKTDLSFLWGISIGSHSTPLVALFGPSHQRRSSDHCTLPIRNSRWPPALVLIQYVASFEFRSQWTHC
jgi:hypothetical protein